MTAPKTASPTPEETPAAMITNWRDKALCVRCERPLTSPGPCQPKNLPSRPTHRSVADLMGPLDATTENAAQEATP